MNRPSEKKFKSVEQQLPEWPAEVKLVNNELGGSLPNIVQALLSGCCPANLTINLSRKLLKVDHILSIANALAIGLCPIDLSLDLKLNNIGAEGARHMNNALASNGCPQGLILNLRYTWIPSTSYEALINALQQNYQVYDLKLDTTDEQHERLHTLLQRNRQFLASQIIPIAQSLRHPHLLGMLNLPQPIWNLVFSYVSWLTQQPQCHSQIKHNTLFNGVLASVGRCYDERRQYLSMRKGETTLENDVDQFSENEGPDIR